MPLPTPLLQSEKPTRISVAHGKLLWFAGLSTVILVLAVHVVTIGRQAPWEDEVFAVSTGLSMARSQSPTLSVLTPYPRTISPIRFYGPVSFEAEALLIRLFGLSLVTWRLACFAGVVLTLLVSIELVRQAGGGKWPRLITGLVLALAGSTATQLPGRWDFITCGLFLSGILLFLRGVEVGGGALVCRALVAGVFIGFALGSTPRALTLCLAAGMSILLTALFFPKARGNLLLGGVGILVIAVFVQTLLLLPWGLNSLSWYAFVKDATETDALNATPMVGRGNWDPNLRYHKEAFLLLLLLATVASFVIVAHRKFHPVDEKLVLKVFLTALAVINLSLMLLLLANALGQSVFWMPPAVIAMMCWLDWDALRARKLGALAAGFVGAALFVLICQEAQQVLAIVLTWNRRNTADLTAFVRRTLPKDAVVYGPVGGYFYPVELSGDHYFYPLEHTTPGLYSKPPASAAEKIEEEACAHPTYAMWPEPDPPHQLWGPMPEALASRVQLKSGEFRQPTLVPWKENLLKRIGHVGGKYGFPDAAIYRLRSLDYCGKK